MKFVQYLFATLLLAVALLVFLGIAAFIPAVQTWAGQAVLDGRPGLKASLGWLSAGFGRVEVTDLRLEVDGSVLTLPSLEARLPLTTAAWNRKVLVRSLVAKGWTLDLSHLKEPDLARAFGGVLSRWKLPCDGSLDGVDLEGVVVLPPLPGGAPARVRVMAKGGGVAAGREGAFAIEVADANADAPANPVATPGRLVVAMDSPRTIGRIEIKADLPDQVGSLPGGLNLSVDVAAARGASGENYTLALSRGRRQVASVLARFSAETGRLAGTWKIDGRDSDLALLAPGRLLPVMAAAGEGSFEADAAFTRIHALGRLHAVVSHLGVLAPPLETLGAVTLDARFDAARSGPSIRVDRLGASLAGDGQSVVVQSLQPIDFDESTGDVKESDPHRDLLEVSVRKFPLACLAGLTDRFTLAGGDATGAFVVRAAPGGFALRPTTPLTAAGVSVTRAGRTLGRGLDLSLALLVDYTPAGWQMQCAPLAISEAGRRLATLEAKASWPAGEDPTIAGTWTADLAALAAGSSQRVGDHAFHPWFSGITFRSASGDFSGSFGSSTEVEGKVIAVGHHPGRSLTANVRVDVDANGAVAFSAPLKIAFGSSVSDVSAQGTWAKDAAGTEISVELTGENVDLEHLRLLAAPLAAAGGVSGISTAGRDRIPFWGDWVGSVRVMFDHLKAGDLDLSDVGGTLDLDHGSIQLEGGRGWLPHHSPAKLEGSISFDSAAAVPYRLKATRAVGEVDVAPLFPPPEPGKEPGLEGHFSVASSFTGSGINLADLASRTQEEFRLTSKDGIIRLLQTSVAEAIPQVSTPVADTVKSAGSLLGALMGVQRDAADSGKNPVSKTAQAVLDFTNQIAEIGYDEIDITAIQGSDHTMRLVEIAMTTPDERVTGSGRIAYIKGRPLFAQPLSVDLQFGARGAIAKLLATAGLLSSRRDRLGYTMLNQPIHLGGTLGHLDESAWHDLLVKAATQLPADGKKGG